MHISINIKFGNYQPAGKHIRRFESDVFQTCRFWQRGEAEDSGSKLNGGSWQTDVRHARSQMTPAGFPSQEGLTRVKQNLTGGKSDGVGGGGGGMSRGGGRERERGGLREML